MNNNEFKKALREAVDIEVKNPGILEVPEGKKVDELSQSHFEKLVKKKGYAAIIKALTNLETWNKKENKSLSQWASNMADKLKEKYRPESTQKNEDFNTYEVAWREFDRQDRVVNKRKGFKTEKARASFIQKIQEHPRFYEIIATSDPIQEAVLNEVKPLRAWNGKLERINDLIDWMIDKEILTKSDQRRKESLFHKYYRFYNDGDFPRGLKTNVTAYDYNYAKNYGKDTEWGKKAISDVENALETQLEEFIKYVLAKYLPRINRREFHRDAAIQAYNHLLDIINDKSISSIKYWLSKLPTEAQEQVDISELMSLYDQYNEIAKEVPDERGYGNLDSKVYWYGRDKVLSAKPEASSIINQIENKLGDLETLVTNMKNAAEQLWTIEGE